MIKTIFYFLSIPAGILLALYLFQPMKRGKGQDENTNYQLVEQWPRLPGDLRLGNPTGIGVDTSGNIVLFHRAGREWPLFGAMPDLPIKSKTILRIAKESGELLDSWGNDLFIMPHGLTVDAENNIWVTDVGLHQVFKFNPNGKLLMKLGEAGVSGDDRLHFNRPTDVAVAKDGSFYVSDGYGNSRVIKFSPAGKYVAEWGKKGNKESEFNIPHGITLDNNGHVYVADRENNRIQVFDPNGRFIKQFTDHTFGAVCGVAFDKKRSALVAVDDLTFLKIKHRGSDVYVFDTTGTVQTRFGRSGRRQETSSWYHDLTVDNDANIYIGDILHNKILKFRKVSAH